MELKDSELYEVERLSTNVFIIKRRDEIVVETPIVCSYTSTNNFSAEYLDTFKNGVTNELTIIDNQSSLLPNNGIGLWLQRIIKSYKYPTNEQLIEDYKNGVKYNDVETAELIISYNLVDVAQNYNNDYN